MSACIVELPSTKSLEELAAELLEHERAAKRLRAELLPRLAGVKRVDVAGGHVVYVAGFKDAVVQDTKAAVARLVELDEPIPLTTSSRAPGLRVNLR